MWDDTYPAVNSSVTQGRYPKGAFWSEYNGPLESAVLTGRMRRSQFATLDTAVFAAIHETYHYMQIVVNNSSPCIDRVEETQSGSRYSPLSETAGSGWTEAHRGRFVGFEFVSKQGIAVADANVEFPVFNRFVDVDASGGFTEGDLLLDSEEVPGVLPEKDFRGDGICDFVDPSYDRTKGEHFFDRRANNNEDLILPFIEGDAPPLLTIDSRVEEVFPISERVHFLRDRDWGAPGINYEGGQ